MAKVRRRHSNRACHGRGMARYVRANILCCSCCARYQNKKKGTKKAHKKQPQSGSSANGAAQEETAAAAAVALNGAAQTTVAAGSSGVQLANGAPVGVEPRSSKPLERSKQRVIVKQLMKQADQQVRTDCITLQTRLLGCLGLAVCVAV